MHYGWAQQSSVVALAQEEEMAARHLAKKIKFL